MSATIDEKIQETIARLETLVAERVRAEQLVDQLTRLPNGVALAEAIQKKIDDGKPFWLAFVEVDRFKSINDQFGYDAADELLKKIGESLRHGCSYFAGNTMAFRSHGDEFFMFGDADARSATSARKVRDSLNTVRSGIAAVRVPAPGDRHMSCTVSVGWLASDDADPAGTVRAVTVAAERAVAEAKHKRDRVVQYSRALSGKPTINLRSDCTRCKCKFSLDLKESENRVRQKLRCPNCGTSVNRPAAPTVERAQLAEKF